MQSASRAHKLTTTDAGGLYLEQVVYGFSPYHKYTLGTDLRDAARPGDGMSIALYHIIARAALRFLS